MAFLTLPAVRLPHRYPSMITAGASPGVAVAGLPFGEARSLISLRIGMPLPVPEVGELVTDKRHHLGIGVENPLGRGFR